MDIFTYQGKDYDVDDKSLNRHGGPFDRGSADSYYHRSFDPHYFEGDTYFSPQVKRGEMTEREVEEYAAGYEYNERFGYKKEW